MEKRKEFFRNILIFLLTLGMALCALSCSNLGASENQNNKNIPMPAAGMGVVYGALEDESSMERTIMPTFPAIDSSTITISATSGTTTKTGTVTTSGGTTTYSILLPYGTWQLTATGKNTSETVTLSQTKTITVSQANNVIEQNFTLSYEKDPAKPGAISIGVTYDTLVGKIVYSWDSTSLTGGTVTAGATKTFTISQTDVTPGSYHLSMLFYGTDNTTVVYRVDQVVNVYSNLTTNKVQGTGDYVIGDGIKVTDTLIQNFMLSTFYVGGKGFGGTNANDANSGSQFDPVATLARAVALVNSSPLTAPTGGFNIIVQGNINANGNIELNAGKTLSIKTTAAGTNYKITGAQNTFTVNEDLTINDLTFDKMRFVVNSDSVTTMTNCSVTGNTVTGNGGGIYIAGNVVVELSSCTFSGNTTTGDGGAIYIADNGEVELSSCKISGNTASGKGGGIYNEGTLTIEDSEIGDKDKTSAATTSSCSNKAANGGGIYTAGATAKVTLAGQTYIAYNRGTGQTSHGGGVDVCDGATLIVGKDSVIQYNSAVYGGGICARNDGGSATPTFTINGKVLNNKASTYGGGIYLANAQAIIGSIDSTAEISDNDCSAASTGAGGGIYIATVSGTDLTLNAAKVLNNTAKNNGGAIYANGTFTITGTVSIPYDATDKKNDVYITKGNKITLGTGFGLETGSEKIGIKLSEYAAGTQVLEGDGVTIDQTLCNKFILLDANGAENTAYRIAPDSSTPAKGVLVAAAVKRSPVYLKGTGGSDSNNGATAENAVATLAHALEILDTTATSPTIIIASAYTLAAGEEGLLNRTSGNAYTIERYYKDSSVYCTGDLITISSGTVTIKNVTIDGNWKDGSGTAQITSNSGALVKITGSSTEVTISDGTTLINNIGSSAGAISNDGKLTIAGGTISATNGRGINNNGELIINGGSIIDNTGTTCGAIFNSGTLTIKDGTISDNTASSTNYGGAIHNSGTLTIEGGTIRGNKSGNNGEVAISTTANITMKGDAKIADDNYVYLGVNSGVYSHIIVTGDLTKDTVARITLPAAKYTTTTQVLEGDGVTIDQAICNKFVLNDKDDPTKICADYIITPDGSTPPKGVLSQPSVGPSIVIISGMTFSLKNGTTEIIDGSEIPLGATLTLSATPQILGGGTWNLPAETTYKIELLQGGSVLKSGTNTLQVLSNSAFAGLICDIRVVVTIPGYGPFDQPINGVKLVSN